MGELTEGFQAGFAAVTYGDRMKRQDEDQRLQREDQAINRAMAATQMAMRIDSDYAAANMQMAELGPNKDYLLKSLPDLQDTGDSDITRRSHPPRRRSFVELAMSASNAVYAAQGQLQTYQRQENALRARMQELSGARSALLPIIARGAGMQMPAQQGAQAAPGQPQQQKPTAGQQQAPAAPGAVPGAPAGGDGGAASPLPAGAQPIQSSTGIGAPIDQSRPKLKNDDGSFSTERTITVGFDDGFYNIPTIINGKQVSSEEAIAAFKSGKNKAVGKFKTQEEAVQSAQVRSEEIGRVRGGDSGAQAEIEENLQKYPQLQAGGPEVDGAGRRLIYPDPQSAKQALQVLNSAQIDPAKLGFQITDAKSVRMEGAANTAKKAPVVTRAATSRAMPIQMVNDEAGNAQFIGFDAQGNAGAPRFEQDSGETAEDEQGNERPVMKASRPSDVAGYLSALGNQVGPNSPVGEAVNRDLQPAIASYLQSLEAAGAVKNNGGDTFVYNFSDAKTTQEMKALSNSLERLREKLGDSVALPSLIPPDPAEAVDSFIESGAADPGFFAGDQKQAAAAARELVQYLKQFADPKTGKLDPVWSEIISKKISGYRPSHLNQEVRQMFSTDRLPGDAVSQIREILSGKYGNVRRNSGGK